MDRVAHKWSVTALVGVALVLGACGGSSKTSSPTATASEPPAASSSASAIKSRSEGIVMKFAKACFELDTETVKNLSSPTFDWTKRNPGDNNISDEGQACRPVALCLLSPESQQFPCRGSEVQQLNITNTICGAGTPADIANGLGSRCLVLVSMALRNANTAEAFRNQAACFLVQEQSAGLLVTKVGGAAPPTGC